MATEFESVELEYSEDDVLYYLVDEDDVDTVDLGDACSLQLSIAAGDNYQGLGVTTNEGSYLLAALAVGKSRDAACVHHAHVGHLVAFSHSCYSSLLQLLPDGGAF